MKISAGHPSGPGALPVLRETNFSNTMDGFIVILDNETSPLLLTLKVGTVFGSSFVKTLEKNLLSALHLKCKICHQFLRYSP